MSRLALCALALVPAALLAAACGDDGDGRRVIRITQADSGCTPATIDLDAGEKVTFEVKNESGSDREVEGVDGTSLDEVIVPSGRTRSMGYTAPSRETTQKIKCYKPGGDATIIELRVSGSAAAQGSTSADRGEEDGESAFATDKAPNTTVNVGLVEFTVTAGVAFVPAGPTKFVATNNSASMVHELAVLRLKADGSYENTGEVEDIDPGKSGEVVLDLPAGTYVLACLIVPGEAGSTTDHFKEGMRLDFTVR